MIHRLGVARSPALAVPLPPTLELSACYRYCEALCRARHHNYPVASMFARSHLRKHIFALFAFARVADDFADEAAYEGRRARELDRWEEQLHAAYRGRADHPVMVALADTADRFALPITELAELLSGFRTDLERKRYATFDELRAYTRQAAEPMGRLLLYIGGYRAPELHAYAEDLSTALAVARLVQDVPADWARGRVYLPAEDLRHFGVTEGDIAARRSSPAIGNLVRYEVARTRALFERARPLVDVVGPDLAVELALMWHGGTRILEKIERVGPRLFAERPQLGTADKALVLARALAWRGETLPPRTVHLAQRLFDRHAAPPSGAARSGRA
ncbi:MAG TPA: squalene synthase HpnC [Kofleriaceae bacterium]|nr:squalene synthase HpnC [Kofleriaceae bacterium]